MPESGSASASASAAPSAAPLSTQAQQQQQHQHEQQHQQQQQQQQHPQHRRRRLRILTVGDGDLSLSLALARCYDPWVEVTATTVVADIAALCATYPDTARTHWDELKERHSVRVLFGVNATQLHLNPQLHDNEPDNGAMFDFISFHHPHLGDDSHSHSADSDGELELLQRHTSLLAHYLHSAAQLLQREGVTATDSATDSATDCAYSVVHVTLCGQQPASWGLCAAVSRLGLEWVEVDPSGDRGYAVSRPFHQLFPKIHQCLSSSLSPWDADPHWQPPSASSSLTHHHCRHRRTISKRHGGSSHWLGQFGYRHVRTLPMVSSKHANAPNLTASRHYVLKLRTETVTPSLVPTVAPTGTPSLLFECPICAVSFATQVELEAHQQDPASPPKINMDVVSVGGDAPTSVADPVPTTTTAMATENEGFQRVQILESSDDMHNNNNTVTVAMQVGQGLAGKRLRWCLQHLLVPKDDQDNLNNNNNNHKMRLSWRRQLPRCIQSFSNGDWNRFIKQGGVSVNGVAAVDTGRILQPGWTIELTLPRDNNNNNNTTTNSTVALRNAPELKVVGKWNMRSTPSTTTDNSTIYYVVWKPVGMRAVGSFDAGTLEETFSRQQQQQQLPPVSYTSLSRLDTGCSGLCVLAPTGAGHNNNSNNIEIVHTFTALVYGHVPDEWTNGITVELPVDAVRRWNKPATTTTWSDTSSSPVPCKQPRQTCTATLICTERTAATSTTSSATTEDANKVPAVSTIAISVHDNSRSSRWASLLAAYLRNYNTNTNSHANTATHSSTTTTTATNISSAQHCHWRQGGHPVVGDRVAVSEYLTLPRAMRNRVKQRFCLGVTRVDIRVRGGSTLAETSDPPSPQQQRTFEHAVPELWRASHWETFCTSKTAAAEGQRGE